MTDKEYRRLTAAEIAELERRGCSCACWDKILVQEPFMPGAYRDVEFSGEVLLGPARGECLIDGVGAIPAGIRHAALADCEVDEGVAIRNVRGVLRNLVIGRGAVIDSVYTIACRRESCFGRDVKVNVLSETGGREVALSPGLTAQMAYLSAFHRHSALLHKRLADMEKAEAEAARRSRACIGAGAVIVNCGEILETDILGHSELRGVSQLINGTVVNARVGVGVNAHDFMFLDGAQVDSGAILRGCLVGEGAVVASGFTAHDTLIFANSRLENGESAAMFAGPFTCSMHKSTLLIGALFSFFNAGSGSNQSNHLYKLGPMHQGVTARGCKTGSDSYILWPAAIGAFTTILGRHYDHPDTRLFPFSLLTTDRRGRSLLIPAATVGSVGLARDVDKWPARDARNADSRDIINYAWLSPYTVGPILAALELLENAPRDKEIEWQGLVIPAGVIAKAIERYRLLVSLFIGGTLRRKMMSLVATNPELTAAQLVERLAAEMATVDPQQPVEHWVDMAGMLAPRAELDRILRRLVEADAPIRREDLNLMFKELNESYYKYSWRWMLALLRRQGLTSTDLTAQTIARLLSDAATAATTLHRLFIADAAKEFDPTRASLSFGLNAPLSTHSVASQATSSGGVSSGSIPGASSHPTINQEVLDDFARVRGSLEGQRFLAQLHQRIRSFTASISNLTSLLIPPL